MESGFFKTGEQRAELVEDLFATIAHRYDLINDLQSGGLHRLWKRRLVTLALQRRPEMALDVCCGTGDVALRLAAEGVQVVGCDFSGPMLSVAARRSREGRDDDRLTWVRADALNLPVASASVDVVTISYGLRNLASFEGGLAELWRVLKPGGRLLVLDFGKPPARLWRALYYAYLRAIVPIFGRLFFGNSATHAYIYDSLVAYPAQTGVDRWLREHGAVSPRTELLLGGMMTINVAEKPRA